MRLSNGARATATALAACALLAACGASPTSSAHSSPAVSANDAYSYGKLPPVKHGAVMGGTINVAEPPGAGPTYIFPIVPGALSSVYNNNNFVDQMWRFVWFGPKGVAPTFDYTQSLAPAPKFSNGNKTVTITLNGGWKWSDGNPVTSTDLSFFYWLLKGAVKLNPANFGNYTPGLFPDNVGSIATPNASTFVINFTKAYNPNFTFLAQINILQPLPAHAWSKASANGPIEPFDNIKNAEAIYKFLDSQAKDTKTYGTNPLWQVVDGPYKIQSFDPATGANTLVANPNYSGPVKPHIATINQLAFTSDQAEFNDFLAGKLDVGFVALSDLPQVGNLVSKGFNVYGYPDFGFSYLVYNFKDTTGSFNKVIGQLYFRQALAHLQDQKAEIKSKGLFDGAGGPSYGAVPAAPVSPFTPANATTDPYPFSISTASKLLSSHGWKVVPNGTTTCVKPGAAGNECGAGIPAGTPLSWTLYYASGNPLTQNLDQAWASNLAQVGIKLTLVTKTFNYLLTNYDDSSAPKNDNTWAMIDFGGFTINYYPTTNNVFNTTGSYNFGGFSNPALDQAVKNSEFSSSPTALQHELSLVTQLQPGLFQPNEDRIYAFRNTLSGPPAGFAAATQLQYSPEYWYYVK